jgi:serpin B
MVSQPINAPLSDRSADAPQDTANCLTRGSTTFALDLYRQISCGSENVFLSPLSIWTALAMARAGARGETAVQIDRLLHLTPESEQFQEAFRVIDGILQRVRQRGEIQLDSATGLWPHADYPVLESYAGLVEHVFRTHITAMDYGNPEAARRFINAWAEERTNSRISDLIPPGSIDSLTRLELTSAIYFRGAWAEPFDPDDTENLPFRVSEAESVTTPMMHTVSGFGYAETPDLQLLEMPYVGLHLSMLVLLPRTSDCLEPLERTLTATDLEKWASQTRVQNVIVTLPRFRITTRCELGNVLQSLGMTAAFDTDMADFSHIDGRQQSLYLAKVFHEAFIDVNEDGTEAAAATAGAMEKEEGDAEELAVFRADHPFLLVLRERSNGAVLFLGRFKNPEGSP